MLALLSPTRPNFRPNFRRIFCAVGMVLVGFFILWGATPDHAYAQSALQTLNQTNESAGFGKASLGEIIGRIIRIFFTLLGIVTIVIVMYGGYVWMMAGGEEKEVERAKGILRSGVIGLIIIFSAFAITDFLMSKIFGQKSVLGGAKQKTEQTESIGDLGSYPNTSALGKVIQSHDPARDATKVVRNSLIQVVYKFPVDPETIIDTSAKNVLFKVTKNEKGEEQKIVVAGPALVDNFKLYVTKEGPNSALKSEQVWVTIGGEGTDSSVITYDPIPLLGSTGADMQYTTELGIGIQRLQPKGTGIFSGFSGGYTWKFTVGTEVDLTAPRVVSIAPSANNTFDRNATVQITFSEPINLASAVGQYDGKFLKFTNVAIIRPDKSVVHGAWRPGGGFNIIEFTPLLECATNSCGQKIFCLPAKETVEVRARSGELQEPGISPQIKVQVGYQGVTDNANNALDGGGKEGQALWQKNNGKPMGSPTDDFYFSFSTTDATKTTAPRVIAIEPSIAATEKTTPPTSATSPVSVTFDTLMKTSTFTTVELRAKNIKAQAGYWASAQNVTVKDAAGKEQIVTKMVLNHAPFAKKSSYAPVIPSTVQDMYQNCFLASGSNSAQQFNCSYVQPANGQFVCCNGVSGTEQCTLLKYGSIAP